MNQYTIYCTPEQTKKALKLGAPIEYQLKGAFKIPTAEQMIGWLEEQGISARGNCFSWDEDRHKPSWQVHIYNKEIDFWEERMWGFSNSRKEAIRAAIDAALVCLTKTSNNNGNS